MPDDLHIDFRQEIFDIITDKYNSVEDLAWDFAANLSTEALEEILIYLSERDQHILPGDFG
jgi:hypothetical protein